MQTILGYLFVALATVLNIVLTLIMIVVIARAILSWVSPDPHNPIVRIIFNMSEPILRPIRRRIPANFGNIDISPIIVFLVVIFLQVFLVNTLDHLGNSWIKLP